MLFKKLKTSEETILIEKKIWKAWLSHDNSQIEKLMLKNISHMNRGDSLLALKGFTEVISLDNAYAEAWNKRATVHYMMGNFKSSIDDINNTLSLEPKHFGALSGLAMIHYFQNNMEQAKIALLKLLQIHPKVNLTRSLKKLLQEINKQIVI